MQPVDSAYIIAGEQSGDMIGSSIMTQMKLINPKIKFFGLGGVAMENAGLRSLFPMNYISLMGIFEILPHIFHIRKLIRQTVDDIKSQKPDVVVTIDSPGFCYRVAKILREEWPEVRLIHVVAPSVWVYKPGRAKKFAEVYDHLLTLLPFEPPYFQKEGLDSTFIGHPVFEQEFLDHSSDLSSRSLGINKEAESALVIPALEPESRSQKEPQSGASSCWIPDHDNAAPGLSGMTCSLCHSGGGTNPSEEKVILVTPGSRGGEIKRHMPIFVEALNKLAKTKEFIACFLVPNEVCGLLDEYLLKADFKYIRADSKDKLKFYASADLALAKSGTNTLEIAASGTPMIVAYKLNFLTSLIIKLTAKVKYASLVNIIAGSEILPEFLMSRCNADALSNALSNMMDNPEIGKKQVREAKKVLKTMGLGAKNTPSLLAANVIMGE